jgi:protein O-GlcNAc transferase
LLRQDPEGRLVLIDGGIEGHQKRLLSERFNRAFPDVADHVIFLQQMPSEKFFGLLTLADAFLDIPTFSGGNSSLEAFAVSAPIVTWPQDLMRGRVTAAFYKQMGVTDLIATDAVTYLELALQLARDADLKQRMQADIQANAHKLFERLEAVRELEGFFLAAFEAWMAGGALSNA